MDVARRARAVLWMIAMFEMIEVITCNCSESRWMGGAGVITIQLAR